MARILRDRLYLGYADRRACLVAIVFQGLIEEDGDCEFLPLSGIRVVI